MFAAGLLGCGVLLFGPYVEFFAVCLYTSHPQLILCALLSATLALAPGLLTSLLYLCWPQAWRWASSSAKEEEEPRSALSSPASLVGSAVLLTVHHVCVLAARVAVCGAAWVVQTRLRRQYKQVLLYSRYRFSLVSFSVGIGFGFTSAVLLGGGQWLDAALHTASSTPGITVYNMDVCPQLPTLLHASLQSFLLTCCHAAWGVMSGQAVAAIGTVGPRVFYRLLHAPARMEQVGNSDETLREGNDLLSHAVYGASPALSTPAEVKGTNRPAVCGANAHTGPSPAPRESQTRRVPPNALPSAQSPVRILSADSRLAEHPKVVCVTLLAVSVLQLSFAYLSLFHGAALDATAGIERASRGCVVSLPLQLVLTTTSVLYAMWLLHVERVKLD